MKKKSRNGFFAMGLVLAVASIATAAQPAWVSLSETGDIVQKEMTMQPAPELTVFGSDFSAIEFEITMDGFALNPVQTKGGSFVDVVWHDCPVTGEIGSPKLPVVRRLFVAPEGATMSLSLKEGEAYHVAIDDEVMPVQAPIEKIEGARKNAPFHYDEEAYKVDTVTSLRGEIKELGVVRGQRLCMLEVYPIDYNGLAGELVWWPHFEATIKFDGATKNRGSLSALPGLNEVVLNPEILPSEKSRGSGNYLIITGTNFESAIAPFAAAKSAQGYTVTTYAVSPGTANSTIKSYITSLWGGANSPDYILLVGDTETIPEWTGGGEGSPDTDIQYACMDGTSDWYPDIAVGRFPADTAAELQAIIDKTLYYENGPLADPFYMKRAVFMASEDNYTVSEGTHNWVIDNHMTPNEYTADKLYQITYGAETQDVRDSFNDGRFFGIYSGHGATTYWADGPPFHQSDVNALTNTNMYSFVFSFACVTGSYTIDECFMETWILAPNKGAVACYGSSVNSYWTEDDVLEKRLFDVIFDDEDTVPGEVGPVYVEARMRYLAEMGSDSTTRRYFEMYNLMGDPSLSFPGNCSDLGSISLDRPKYQCSAVVNVQVGDCGLNLDDSAIDTVEITIASDSEPAGEVVTLTETGANTADFRGFIEIIGIDLPGVLMVSEGDTLVATYEDADDGTGASNTVTATAVVDCAPPTVSNVHMVATEPRGATVGFDASEPAVGSVDWGTSCADLPNKASGSGYVTSPTVTIEGLTDETTYFYVVVAEDEAGNAVLDDNGGACYSFTTPDIPDFFTEIFEGEDNDLDNIQITFRPNGTYEYYDACVESIAEFPVDPAGGTTIAMDDDDSSEVNPSIPVHFYGTDYTSFHIISNGSITFGIADTDYSETLAEHFEIPRIAPMWDDYDPVDGGTISWKELSDRVVVTFDEVREYNTTNTVSFQVELVDDGTIIFNYLDVQVTDGLVGLSRGVGVDENFLESDMSGYGNCGPRPPHAVSKTVEFAFDTPNTITLEATDDGLPEPANLTYIIDSLPSQGELSDGGTIIDSVPFTLSGNEVVFTPETGNYNSTSFQFKANDGGIAPEGGDSDVAVISIDIVEPTPPTCEGHSYAIAANGSQYVVLVADDDGNPVPPGALTYIITELPENGYLKYANMPVGSVPFEMSDNFLTYYPHSGYQGLDSFSFKVNDGGEAPYGGDSNTSVVDFTIGGTQVIYDFPMDTDPGWSTTGDWAFGQPTGAGSHEGDPSSGYTGSNVYGYNLAGDYANNMGTETLTTTTMDLSGVSGATLKFQRWLGVESSQYDHARLELYNGSWNLVWNHDGSSFSEDSWNLMEYDISALADGHSNIRLRWTMGITDGGVTYPGWNIDDVQISGLLSLADNDAPVIEAGSWKSLADHGEAGELAIALADTGRTCEPRWLSTYKLQLMFSEPVVVPTGAVTATGLENGPFTGEATLDATGLVLTVVFEGANQLVERDIYTIDVADSVTDLAGNALTGDRSVELVVLTGNLTDNAGANKINAFDKSLIIARLGQTVEQAGVEFDIACTGRSAGVIDAFDKSLLISRLGSEIEE